MIGIDEVGRGCWAGPLVIVAARQVGELPVGLKDSKLLTKKKRQALFYDIEVACELGEGWVQPGEIDACGLSEAMKIGVTRALKSLGAKNDEVIIMDGSINYCAVEYTNASCVIKADSLHPIVSAASIYAKVKRDTYMAEVAKEYPDYQFDKHVGYGTKLHHEMLKQFGVSPLHRVSFKPIKGLLYDNV